MERLLLASPCKIEERKYGFNLQKYMQADYIYIPAKTEQHKSWGELSGYRKELEDRNKKIISDYKQGISMENLADFYHLSVYAIRKIVYKK